MSFPLLIRAEEWLALLLAFGGVLLGLHFGWDNRRDLVAYRQRGWDGFAELAAVQGIRSGYAKGGLHAMLAVLPIVSLTVTPVAARYVAAVIFYAALITGQALVVGAQALNWRDRNRLLRKLEAAP